MAKNEKRFRFKISGKAAKHSGTPPAGSKTFKTEAQQWFDEKGKASLEKWFKGKSVEGSYYDDITFDDGVEKDIDP